MRLHVPLRTILSLLLVACLVTPVAAAAYTNSDVAKHQAAADAARKKAATEQQKANDLLAQSKALEGKIDGLEAEIASLGSQIGTASARRDALDAQMNGLRAEISAKQEEISLLQVAYDERVAALNARVDTVYRDGDWAWLEVLLSSQSIADFVQRTEYVNLLISDDEAAATELESTRVQLDSATASLDRAVESLSIARAEVKAQVDGLARLRASQDDKRAAQQAAQDQKNALLAETKKNIARLRAQALAEEQESARIANLLRNSGSHGTGRYAGTFAWPTPGHTRVTSPFGYRIHPILKVRKLHTGIDIGAPSGSPIVAAGRGTVIFAGYNGGYGNFVMVDHGNGLVTCYAHQSRIAVGKGQSVNTGQTIGYVGTTGLSTGPHLHFEVRVNGTPVDPMGYL